MHQHRWMLVIENGKIIKALCYGSVMPLVTLGDLVTNDLPERCEKELSKVEIEEILDKVMQNG